MSKLLLKEITLTEGQNPFNLEHYPEQGFYLVYEYYNGRTSGYIYHRGKHSVNYVGTKTEVLNEEENEQPTQMFWFIAAAACLVISALFLIKSAGL